MKKGYAQREYTKRIKTPLTNDKDWCKKCGKFIPTTWTEPPFSMPIRKCNCEDSK